MLLVVLLCALSVAVVVVVAAYGRLVTALPQAHLDIDRKKAKARNRATKRGGTG